MCPVCETMAAPIFDHSKGAGVMLFELDGSLNEELKYSRMERCATCSGAFFQDSVPRRKVE